MLEANQASAQFRMGAREARKAMAGGGLLAAVTVARRDQFVATMEKRNVEEVATALHSMAGPFNVRMLSTDIDSSLMGSAELMSTRLAMTIIDDVFGANAALAPMEFVGKLIDAMCDWIDMGRPKPETGVAISQSNLAARLMAKSLKQDIDGPDATAARLHAVARFAPALGVIGAVLGIPADHPTLLAS